MTRSNHLQILKKYHRLGFNLVPLKPRSKVPLVRWKGYQLRNKDFLRFLGQGTNWAIRCDEVFHVLDFDDAQTYMRFSQEPGEVIRDCPLVKTGRGYHIWFKPKRAVKSFSRDGVEVKGRGSLVMVLPSIHPSGTQYHFVKPLDGNLPQVAIEQMLGLPWEGEAKQGQPTTLSAPFDFALRYGKSPYPQSLCGKATRVLTTADGRAKHLLSLHCWKWHCLKCAPLLRHHWLEKLSGCSFRFILRIPGVSKPTAFLRRIGKPDYIHWEKKVRWEGFSQPVCHSCS